MNTTPHLCEPKSAPKQMSKEMPMSDSIKFVNDQWTIGINYVIHVLHRKSAGEESQHLDLGEMSEGTKFSEVFQTTNAAGGTIQKTVIRIPTSISGTVRFVFLHENARKDFPLVTSLDWMETCFSSNSAATWAGEL